jgi:prepilin-type N-terminal cleavage/methylation domain-containing protein
MRHLSIPVLSRVPAKGFTLIELLVVIAVLVLLAAVVLVALDPLEQTARARDSGRISTVAQLGHAIQAYATATGDYPTVSTQWQQVLITEGEIKQAVAVPRSTVNCGIANNMVNNICYVSNPSSQTDVVVWTVLESKNSKAKASPDTAPCAKTVIAMYTTIKGQAGVTCVDSAASVTGNETLY